MCRNAACVADNVGSTPDISILCTSRAAVVVAAAMALSKLVTAAVPTVAAYGCVRGCG